MNLGFVIGCTAHEDPVPNLRFAANDAARFAAVLQDVCGLGADQIVLLHDDAEAQRDAPRFTNILRALSQGARALAAGVTVDTLYFFFSGHGYHSDATGDDYLLAADSVADDLEHTALSIREVVRLLGAWRPRHVVMFIDACREALGDAKALAGDLNAPDVNGLLPPGHVTFCSCSAGQRSYEAESLAAGVFTEALCEALSDVGRCRTLHELHAYLQRRVPELAAVAGRPGQTPTARLEPPEILGLEIVSPRVGNLWRSSVPVGEETRLPRLGTAGIGLMPERGRLCVDLGTCNSLIGLWDGDRQLRVIPDRSGRGVVPSLVNFSPDLDFVVGWAAVDADRTRPEGTVRHVKRRLGTDHQYLIHGRSLSPELVASLILRSLKRNAEDFLGIPVNEVVASYPASFGIAQCNGLARAFELAGLEVTRFVGEPSAAGMLVAGRAGGGGVRGLVVDLGGGTLDVSVVEIDVDEDDGGFNTVEVLGTSGRSALGGVDYDEVLVEHLTDRLRDLTGATGDLPSYLTADLRREAERAKHVLTVADECLVVVPNVELTPGVPRDVHILVERSMFRSLSAHLDLEVVRTIREAVAEVRFHDIGPAHTRPEVPVTAVLLAGQGTKIPSLREAVAREAGAPVVAGFQDDAVLRGLVRQAAVLTGAARNTLLLDNLYRGIGVWLHDVVIPDRGEGGRREGWLADGDDLNDVILPLIDRGETIPTRRTCLVRVRPGGAARRQLRIVELRRSEPPFGEIPVAEVELDCTGRERQYEVAVDIDANGTIVLSVRDPRDDSRQVLKLN